MNTETIGRKGLLALACAFAVLAACGGGGDDGGDDSGNGQAPPGGGNPVAPPPPPLPTFNATVPFAAGKRWLYEADHTNSITGSPVLHFVGDVLLQVDQEISWQGRTAWRLRRFDLSQDPGADLGFGVSTMHVSQGAGVLEKWVGTSTQGQWKTIMSAQTAVFTNNTFLVAGGPTRTGVTELTSAVPRNTPSGSYQTVLAYHEFDQDGDSIVPDIEEQRWEYYAHNVGLVGATWDYTFDDSDFSKPDIRSVGTMELKGIDTGPSVVAEIEPNDDGTAVGSQALALTAIYAARTHISNPGRIVADPNVTANVQGLALLQDWYRFTHATTGPRHIALLQEHFDASDLDLYLFREGAGGALTFVARSVRDPTSNDFGEWIARDLPAGTYHVAVQAWNTPAEEVNYWVMVR